MSSANYPARAKGVRAGMTVGAARELCGGDLAVMPFQFDKYTEVGARIYGFYFLYWI